MKNRVWLVAFFLCLSFIIFVYHRWFLGGALSAPDFTYLYGERLGEFDWLPSAWSSAGGSGIGGTTFAQLNLDSYLHIGIRLFVFVFHIPWSIASRLIFFWPFLFLGFVGSYYFVKSVLKSPYSAFLGVIVYLSNTYILMIAGGGQVGLMMAYAVAPFVFGSFIRKDRAIFTIASIIFIIFDIRYAYILYAAIILYAIWLIPVSRWVETIRYYAYPILWITAANLFWFIPLILAPSFGLPQGYGDPGWLMYLSWADFSKTLSFLHPNWPENIFGKTYFMRPEFLILPLVAFIPLSYPHIQKRIGFLHYYFFAVLLLVGAFLAKGVSGPFGEVYTWLFIHVPMFNGFRDPTKFYVLIALSYTFLLPYSVECLQAWLSKRGRPLMRVISPYTTIIFIVLWCGVLLSPVWKGELRGTFEQVGVGSDYVNYERLVQSDSTFYRTLSVPWRQRFLFQSEKHPLLNASDIFKSSDIDIIIQNIKDPRFEHMLKSLAVRYVVVPDDTKQEIFLTDRSYDPQIQKHIVDSLDTITFLSKRTDFSGLSVYEYKKQIGHFYRELENLDVVREKEKKLKSTIYSVDIDTAIRPVQINFSEAYDPAWKLWDGEKYISSKPTSMGLNSFVLDSDITSRVTVWYSKEQILEYSYMATLVGVIFLTLVWLLKSKRFDRKKIIFVSILISIICIIVQSANVMSSRKVYVSDDNIWHSPQWRALSNPLTREFSLSSRIGGSEIHFSVANTESLTIEADGANKEKNEQLLIIRVNGKEYELASPFTGKTLTVPINSTTTHDTVPVDIVLFCDSAMVPCDVRITKLLADRYVVFKKLEVPFRKTFAILGDSITTSFGRNNYSYTLAKKLGFHMHNASVFGSSVTPVPGWDSGLLRVTNDIVSYKPDIVMVFIGTNDLGRGIPLSEFKKNYKTLIAQIKLGSPLTQIIAVGLLTRNDFSENMIRSYSKIIEEVARLEDVSYIDPILWLRSTDLQDVVHPSSDSQSKLVDKFYEAVHEILTRE